MDPLILPDTILDYSGLKASEITTEEQFQFANI